MRNSSELDKGNLCFQAVCSALREYFVLSSVVCIIVNLSLHFCYFSAGQGTMAPQNRQVLGINRQRSLCLSLRCPVDRLRCLHLGVLSHHGEFRLLPLILGGTEALRP